MIGLVPFALALAPSTINVSVASPRLASPLPTLASSTTTSPVSATPSHPSPPVPVPMTRTVHLNLTSNNLLRGDLQRPDNCASCVPFMFPRRQHHASTKYHLMKRPKRSSLSIGAVVAITITLLVMCAQATSAARVFLQQDASNANNSTTTTTTTTSASSSSSSSARQWLYLTIPLISALVGYVTNVVALKMTFYPLEFTGVKLYQPKDQPFGFFGWQGIIPSKAGKMASIMTDLMLEKLVTTEEVFARLDPVRMGQVIEPAMRAAAVRIYTKVGVEYFPFLYYSSTDDVREFAREEILRRGKALLVDVISEFRERVKDCFDIKHMIVTNSIKNKLLVVNMFQTVGAKEFVFIERSGAYFGFLFGVVQAVVFYFADIWWLLPLFGFFVGYATNWVALKVIFEPIEPISLGPLGTLQGLFLKRQPEVSLEFAKLSATSFLNAESMWEEILYGAYSDRFWALFDAKFDAFFDKEIVGGGYRKTVMACAFGGKGVLELKAATSKALADELYSSLCYGNEHLDAALGLEETMAERLAALPPKDFEGVLHPVFQEDEIKLIAVGGLLGMGVGFLQTLMYI